MEMVEKDMRLDELIAFTEISSQSGDIDKDISSVTYDSRKVKKDSLFVAIDGFKSDGHKYIAVSYTHLDVYKRQK